MKHLHQLFLTLALLTGLSLSAQTEYRFNAKPDGFSVASKSNTTLNIDYNVSAVTIEEADRDGLEGQFITLTGIHIANQAGAPDLPSSSAFVAIPNGAKASLSIVNSKTKLIKDIDLIPAPLPQLDNDDSKAVYEKDPSIYHRNAFYPATPYQISEVMTVRGVEMVQVGVMPFQYNPVTKELLVYEDMELQLTYEGGDGTYGDNRYRTPEWDQILSDMLLNREVLPKVDYGEMLRKHYENRETGCEYIIITPDNEDFIQLADSIKQFRINQGIPTEVFTVDQCGGNEGTAIRNFIRNAYNTWDMPPAAVLILGDHHADGTKGVVSFTMNNHPGGDGYNPYISDHAYAVTGNNHMPNIIIGRITGRDFDELYRMIKKDLDYERNPPTNPDFYDKPVTAMGFQLERWFQLCSEVVNGFWEYGLEKHPVRLNAIYQGNPGSLWSTYEYTNTVLNYFGPTGCGYVPNNMSHLTDWSANGNKVNEAINNGAFILQHRDHGAEELWGEPSYTIGYIKRLTNNDLTYVMSNNCLTGRFNYNGDNGCFAEAFHRHQYGALGLVAATQVSYSFVNDVYVWGVYDNMWPDFLPTYGTQHATNFILPAFGNAAGKYFLRQSSWTDDGVKEITYYLFHQHGDAYMNLYSEMPQHLDIEMLPVLIAGRDSYTIKVDEGATVCLTVGDKIIGFGQGTGTLQEIPVTPQETGTRVRLTIKKQNYYRYEHELATIPAEGPYLIFNAAEINDENGNHNQTADYNETFQLHVSLQNVGSDGIDNVTASLSCPNPEVHILQDQASYSNIEPNGIQTVNNAFTVQLGDGFMDGESVRLYLHLGNNSTSFTDSIQIAVNAPLLQYTNLSFSHLDGEPSDRLLRGASTLLTFDIQNIGHSKSLELNHDLFIKAPFLSIAENHLTIPEIEAGDVSQVTFRVDVHDDAPGGNILDYIVDAQSGYHTATMAGSIQLGYTIEDFEGDTLNPLLGWELGSQNKFWYVAEDPTATGGHCLRSPELGNNKKASLFIAITCDKPGTVSFQYKTSSEQGDKLTFYINNKEQAAWSGENDWEEAQFDLKEGFNLLKFVYKKDSDGSAGEDCAFVDEFYFPPLASLILFAEDEAESCPNEPFTPHSYASNYNGILWNTNGDGTFDDPTLEQPTYHFGTNDLDQGQVTLTMTATSSLDETQQSKEILVNLLDDFEGITPNAPIGETHVDLRLLTASEYHVDMEETNGIVWTLEPTDAGVVESEGMHATVTWDDGFRGFATLGVKLGNACGESEETTLDIEVINSTSVNDDAYAKIMVYPNPAKDQICIKSDALPYGQVLIRMIDSQGKVVFSTEKHVSDKHFETQVNVADFRSGLYDIQIISEKQAYNTHIVVF